MPPAPSPSDFELDILRVLWRGGPATVREVHDALHAERQMGYTTVLKTMQIMVDKGQLLRDETSRSHVYRAASQEAETLAGLVRGILTKAFGGSSRKLVLAALQEAPLPPEEEAALLEDIRKAREGR